MKEIFRKLAEWLSPKYRYLFCEDFPDKVKDKVIYIVGEGRFHWVLVFQCPCGCGHTIQLNLLNEADPCWTFQISKKHEISIWPSVWRTTGCKSHFIVQNGKIEWVRLRRQTMHL